MGGSRRHRLNNNDDGSGGVGFGSFLDGPPASSNSSMGNVDSAYGGSPAVNVRQFRYSSCFSFVKDGLQKKSKSFFFKVFNAGLRPQTEPLRCPAVRLGNLAARLHVDRLERKVRTMNTCAAIQALGRSKGRIVVYILKLSILSFPKNFEI